MSVRFSFNHDDGIMIVTYSGTVTDDIVLTAWKNFFQDKKVLHGYHVLADLSQADLSKLTSGGIERLSEFTTSLHEKYDIRSIKVANYAPQPLAYGLARVYEGVALDSVEQIRAFKDLEEALAWLKEDTPDG